MTQRGAKRGDRIAILSANSDHYAEAITRLSGAAASPRLSTPVWRRRLDRSHDRRQAFRLLMVDQIFAAAGEAYARAATTVIGMDAEICWVSFDQLIETGEAVADHSGSGSAVAGILFKGATTGRSNEVMLSHADLPDPSGDRAVRSGRALAAHPAPLHLAGAKHLFGLKGLSDPPRLPGFTPSPRSTPAYSERAMITFMISLAPP